MLHINFSQETGLVHKREISLNLTKDPFTNDSFLHEFYFGNALNFSYELQEIFKLKWNALMKSDINIALTARIT